MFNAFEKKSEQSSVYSSVLNIFMSFLFLKFDFKKNYLKVLVYYNNMFNV